MIFEWSANGSANGTAQLGATSATGLFDPNTSALLSSFSTIAAKAQAYLPTIINIVEDPALPLVVQKIQVLRALEVSAREEAKAKHEPQPGPPGPVGIGLWRIAGVMAAYIWTREHPWAFRGIVAGSVLGLFAIGFGFGRLSKR